MYLLYSLQTSSLQNINKKFASVFIRIVKKHWYHQIKMSCFFMLQSHSLNYKGLIMVTCCTLTLSNLAGS